MRVRGDFWGGGRGQGETPAGPMSPRGPFTFFSIQKVLTDTTAIRHHPIDRPHNTLPQDVRPFGYPKTSSQPFLTSFPINQSSQTTQPHQTSFFGPQPRSSEPAHPDNRTFADHPASPPSLPPRKSPAAGGVTYRNRIYAGPGGLLGGGRGQGETPAGPMSPRGPFTFFSIQKVLTDTTAIRHHPIDRPRRRGG